jgi:thiosulfate/3-mercaptopyruvate sulfurtransferase
MLEAFMLFVPLAPLMAFMLAHPGSGPADPVAEQPLLVNCEWLAAHLHDSNLVLFEVGKQEEYAAGHIPGAQWIDYWELAAPHDMNKRPMGLMLELPSQQKLDSVLSARGVSNDSRIVVYFAKDRVSPAARAVLSLEYAGLRGQVSLLDGGRPEWVREGRPVTTEPTTVMPAKFTSHPRSDVVVTVEWLSARLHDPGIALFDARDSSFYLDTEDNGMPRGGHIPGARSVPFTSVVDDSLRLKDRASLERIFRAAGATPGKMVVSYCHIGQQGSLVFFAARYLGYEARLYDGSFEEWSAKPELAVEGVNPRKPQRAQ